MTDYVRAVRAPDTTFRACGFRGCTSFASHVLYAGNAALCFVCGQCASHALHSNRPGIIPGEALRKFRNEVTILGIELPKAAKRFSDRMKVSRA